MPPVARYAAAPQVRHSVSLLGEPGRGPRRQQRPRRDSLSDAYLEYSHVGHMSEISSSSTDSIRDEIKSARNYVDPWDLENYVYLKRQCSDGSSDPVISLSTAGDVDSTNSDFYYVSKSALKAHDLPANPSKRRHSVQSNERPRSNGNRHRTARSMAEIEEEMFYEGPYDLSAEMDNLCLHERASRPRKPSVMYNRAFPDEHFDPFQNGEYECEYAHSPFMAPEFRQVDYPVMHPSKGGPRPYWQPPPLHPADSPPMMYVYQKSRSAKTTLPLTPHSKSRRVSHSSTLSSSDDYCSSNDTPSRQNTPEMRIGMSTFGHMKIDYSWNWNNLDRYIGQY